MKRRNGFDRGHGYVDGGSNPYDGSGDGGEVPSRGSQPLFRFLELFYFLETFLSSASATP